MSKRQFLAQVPLFSGLDGEALDRLAEGARYVDFKRGQAIIKEGETGGGVYVIVSGSVEVVKDWGGRKEKRLRVMEPRDYFGEMAVIDDMPRSASVIAREGTRVLHCEQVCLEEMIAGNPALAWELLRALSRRIRGIEEGMMEVLCGLLPICAACKKIRDEDDNWQPLEVFIRERSEAEFSHSICPECARKLYPEIYGDD